MIKYPTPAREGHWWAKLRLHDNPDLRSVDWEVVQVFDNNGNERNGAPPFMASVPGIEGGQRDRDTSRRADRVAGSHNNCGTAHHPRRAGAGPMTAEQIAQLIAEVEAAPPYARLDLTAHKTAAFIALTKGEWARIKAALEQGGQS